MEMLIVVAIIAVLVVVSIPMVNASLEEVRLRTDQANERAAKAAALADYLLENRSGQITYFYHADGTVRPDPTLVGLTQSLGGTPGYDYGQSEDYRRGCIFVSVTETAGVITVDVDWEVPKF